MSKDHKQNIYLGKHLLIDCWGCKYLNNESRLRDILESAVSRAGATLLHTYTHKFGRGGGISGVAVLAESHISVHSWPEYSFTAFDIFMCGKSDPELALKELTEQLEPERIQVSRFKRAAMERDACKENPDEMPLGEFEVMQGKIT